MRNQLLRRAAAIAVSLMIPSGVWSQDAGSTYGHARTRALANLGKLPTPRDVAIADIINFHRHRLPMPRAGEAVALDLRFGAVGVDRDGEAVLQIGMAAGAVADRRELPPLNLGLVIDCSGSMRADGKLDAVQRALRELVRRLRPNDHVTLVAYSDAAERRGSELVGDGAWLSREIDRLEPGGSTNLHAGLMLGLQEVAARAKSGAHDRVILLTDGIANRGETEPAKILRDARTYTAEQVDLATIGVGTELNTELLDQLARGARGLFHFVADTADIEKVFVDELQAQVRAVARSVQIHLRLPAEFVSVEFLGFPARRGDRRTEWTIDVPDLNSGATQVVLARCRLDREARSPRELEARAELRYRRAGDDRAVEVETTAHLDPRADGDGLTDPEVRKNYTIARLALGMHEMADAASRSCWAEADRALRRELRFARDQFASREDTDVRRVVEIAEQYREVLARYIDRFRDG
ncbi:MAG: VWA domain-containing protein [Planctomycetota bacterium]